MLLNEEAEPINAFLFHGLYLLVNILRGSRVVSEGPTKALNTRWFPADCSKLYIVTEFNKNPSSIIVRSSQHIVIFKGRAKWLFINPPIVNINTKPKANNIEGVNLTEPP